MAAAIEAVSDAGDHADEPSSWFDGTRGEAVALVRAALEELRTIPATQDDADGAG